MPKKKSSINSKALLMAFLGILLAIVLGFYLKTTQFYSKIYTGSSILDNNTDEPKTEFNILLMGYGGGKHQGTYLTDTMMVAHIDTKTKKALLISIPRDTWVAVPTRNKDENFHAKINSVYQMGLSPRNYPSIESKYQSVQGSAELLKVILKHVTGLTIDNYVAVDFAGFTRGVDLLGGASIIVDKSFDDFKYPIDGMEDDPCGKEGEELDKAEKEATESPELIFPCRYENLHFDAGRQQMDGKTALKYVRSRQSAQDGGDFARARRQQRFIEAMREKILNVGIVTKIVPLMDELQDHIRTDINSDQLGQFISETDNAREYSLSHFVLSTNNHLKETYSFDRQYILIPTRGEDIWVDVRTDIRNTIIRITPTPKLSPTIIKKKN